MKRAVDAGSALFGTVDSWLLWVSSIANLSKFFFSIPMFQCHINAFNHVKGFSFYGDLLRRPITHTYFCSASKFHPFDWKLDSTMTDAPPNKIKT